MRELRCRVSQCGMTAKSTAKSTSRSDSARAGAAGYGQLSLVEHSLCPLDARVSLQPGLVHYTSFQYSDRKRRRQTARVEVSCPQGLSAHDEFYLWGLLALTLSQGPIENELHATPHFCLRQFGLVDAETRRGGRQYQHFAAAVERLSWVRYGCDAFYDPIRVEHCQVRFGFFSYRLPLEPTSNRAWRFHWDTQFLEFVRGAGGSLRFDLERYRRLSPAARRLFLFVSKVFRRLPQTPRLDLRQLAVEIVGLSPLLPAKHLLAKTRRICSELAQEAVVRRLDASSIQKRGAGNYDLVLMRHEAFEQRPASSKVGDSPLVEPLRAIGLDATSILRVLRRYPVSAVREWVDITMAAQERFGPKFFNRSPAAYFVDNVQKAAAAGRTPPDWWHDIRKAEERRQAAVDRTGAKRSRQAPGACDSQTFNKIRADIFEQLQSADMPQSLALSEATRRAQQQCYPDSRQRAKGLASAGAILARLPLKVR
jgi:hypothetical protein